MLQGGAASRARADLGLLVDGFTAHGLDLTLELDDFVRQVPVLDLKLLQGPVVETHSVPVLLLPLLRNLLLLDHHSVSALFVALVSLFRLKELVLEVGHLDIALVVELVDAAVEDDLETVEL